MFQPSFPLYIGFDILHSSCGGLILARGRVSFHSRHAVNSRRDGSVCATETALAAQDAQMTTV